MEIIRKIFFVYRRFGLPSLGVCPVEFFAPKPGGRLGQVALRRLLIFWGATGARGPPPRRRALGNFLKKKLFPPKCHSERSEESSIFKYLHHSLTLRVTEKMVLRQFPSYAPSAETFENEKPLAFCADWAPWRSRTEG